MSGGQQKNTWNRGNLMVVEHHTPKQTMSFFKEAREILRSQPAGARVDILRERIDELQEAYDLFVVERTSASLTRMLGRWARVQVAIDAITGSEPTPPSAGKMELPLAA